MTQQKNPKSISQNKSKKINSLKIPINNKNLTLEYESDKAMPVMEKPKISSMTEKESLTKYGEFELFFSKDKKYLDQYYQMRHDIFNVEYGWKEYDGSECKFDREGKVVIATHNGEVVGGMRIMFSDCCEYLSNEVPGTQYEYRKLIQKYDNREDLVFGEISSLFVKKDYRHSEVATSMMEKLFNKAKDHGCNYIFAVAVATVCRNDRRTAKRFGYDVEIVMQYPWLQKKVFNYVRLFPMYSKLK